MDHFVIWFLSLALAFFSAQQGNGTRMRQPVEHRRSNWIQLSRMGFSDFPVKKPELQNDQVDLAIVQKLLSEVTHKFSANEEDRASRGYVQG